MNLLAHRLPLDQKIHGSVTKCALRQALYKRLPRELFERPKAGFTIPVGNWLRGELRPWAEDLLAQIPSQGYLRAEPIQERWQQHQQKRRDWTGSLWAVLMFQAWLNEHQAFQLQFAMCQHSGVNRCLMSDKNGEGCKDISRSQTAVTSP